jgi:hypothetical protein
MNWIAMLLQQLTEPTASGATFSDALIETARLLLGW